MRKLILLAALVPLAAPAIAGDGAMSQGTKAAADNPCSHGEARTATRLPAEPTRDEAKTVAQAEQATKADDERDTARR